MKITVIIQARMGSSRLPGKMLLDICGKPAVERVVERVKLVKNLDSIFLATTVSPLDDKLYNWAIRYGLDCYRGSEEDVLDRYYQTALLAKADVLVRITGDCPLADPEIISGMISFFRNSKYDYVCNTQPPTFPDGLDVEVFSSAALNKAWVEAKLKSEREHVTPFIWKHPEIFKIKNLTNDVDLSKYRWTLDTPEDLIFIKLVIQECDRIDGNWGMADVVQIVSAHPEWLKWNQHYKRNEGYTKSIKED